METYLNEALPRLKRDFLAEPSAAVTLVLGNESGDLDSAVCTLALASSLHRTDINQRPVLPLFAFNRRDLPLRTEVLKAFELENLRLEHCLFADEVNASDILNVEVILVDHNVINVPRLKFLEDKVNQVIDHHILERKTSDSTRMVVQKCGSCSTLVAEWLLARDIDPGRHACALIRSTILVDTGNLDPAIGLTTPKDLEILAKMEAKLPNFKERHLVYDELSRAKSDVSSFSVNMLLRKDVKVIHTGDNVKVSVSSIPGYSCRKLSEKHPQGDFARQIRATMAENEWKLAVLIGQGDMIVLPSSHPFATMIKKKAAETLNDLGLVFEREDDNDLSWYQRTRPDVFRKKILPMIKDALNQC